MRVHILGCGVPIPQADRFGSSYVVKVGDEYLMFDCGPATTFKLVRAGIRPTWVDYLFFTHHHFDHDVDYPCFLLTRWTEGVGKIRDLQVFGPTLTERLTHRLMDEKEGAFAHDWLSRVNHPVSIYSYVSRGGVLPRMPPVVRARDVGPGKVVKGKTWEVTAAHAEHVQPWLDSLAYRLDTEEGSLVVTGDTRPCRSVVELAMGAGTLISLCTYIQEEIAGTPEDDSMTGTIGAAQMAQDAGVKTLVLVHQAFVLDRPGQTERALRDITGIFKGRVIWGREMLVFDV